MSQPEDTPEQGPGAPSDPIAEREALIAKLEKDLERPRVGVVPPVAAIAFLGALFLASQQWADVQYFFSSRAPLELGAEGNYAPERAVSNRYAQLHGVPSVRGWYVDEVEGSFVVVGVNDTPFLVKRTTFPDEDRRGADGKRPQPRQNAFFARGRLLSRDDAGRYAEVFTEFEAWSGTKAQWLLLAEQPPGRDLKTVSMFGFLVLFAAVNGWLFVRGLTLRRRR
jgi:hypothetical protein